MSDTINNQTTIIEESSPINNDNLTDVAKEQPSKICYEVKREIICDETVNEWNAHPNKYEVVFFIQYNITEKQRPSESEIKKIFDKYGKVHHIKCPDNKDYAFIYIVKLHTNINYKRTRTTINQIISDTPEKERFFIDVARSPKQKSTINPQKSTISPEQTVVNRNIHGTHNIVQDCPATRFARRTTK